ncbi:MAG: Sec-independent protein translocase, TatC subunit [Chloroflexi bacterium]|nr:Sec-independent protein translocase, TatC subunit [Chloroflexota bacterium]
MNDAPHDHEMTILEHLAALRRCLIIAGIGAMVGMAFAAAFLTWPVFTLLTAPVAGQLQALRPTENFAAWLKVMLITGIGIAMPVIVWQALLFVLPALHTHERKWVFIAVPGITMAFAFGITFGYFLVVPAAVGFLAGFGSEVVETKWSVDYYLSFVTSFLFWIGLSFETPLVMFFLAKLGVVNARQLGHQWRYALVVSFVLGALITPTPDPFNQSLVSVPIFLLYGLGVLLARFA